MSGTHSISTTLPSGLSMAAQLDKGVLVGRVGDEAFAIHPRWMGRQNLVRLHEAIGRAIEEWAEK